MKRIKKWKRRGSASSDGVTPRPRQSSSSLCDKHPSSRSAADLHFNGGPKASITEVSHVPDIAILDINIKPTRTATGFNVSRKGSVGNKSNLSLSTGAPTIVAHTSQTIWDEALEKLTLKQQKSLHNCNSSKPTDSTELINAVRSKQYELQTLSWDYSFKLGKRTYDVKKLMENVVTWVGRFISIGDIIVQYDPTHIALPWAGIRFLLQVGGHSTVLHAIVFLINTTGLYRGQGQHDGYSGCVGTSNECYCYMFYIYRNVSWPNPF